MTTQPSSPPSTRRQDERVRLAAAALSLAVAIVLLGVKYVAYRMTDSTAILSDALESIVNVVAAAFAIGVLAFAARPADRNHPYGHGKIEFFAAAFEGGLISFAAILIVYQALLAMVLGRAVRAIDVGLLLTGGAGVANAALGWFLLYVGKRYQSLTLTADGHHVLSDFWTSLGVIVGLVLVGVTGWSLFDPLVAVLFGINLSWTGFRLVRHAAGGLLDEEDTALLDKLVTAINANVTPGIIRVHYLRAIRVGRFTHVDAHLVVPEFWTVQRAHDTAVDFEQRMLTSLAFEGEVAFHTDPCRQMFCSGCDVQDCPIRVAPFAQRMPISVAEAVTPDVIPQSRAE